MLSNSSIKTKYLAGDSIIYPNAKNEDHTHHMFIVMKGSCVIMDENREKKGSLIKPELYGELNFLNSFFRFNKRNVNNKLQVIAKEETEIQWMEDTIIRALINMDTTGFGGRFLKFVGTVMVRRQRQVERLKYNV